MLRAMTEQPIALERVESFLRERRKSLTFPTELEVQFERDTRHRRAEFLRAVTLKTVLTIISSCRSIGLFFVTDRLLYCVKSFFIVTPWIIFVAWRIRGSLSEAMRECAAASVPIAIALEIAAGYWLSKSSYASYSLYTVLITLIYAHLIQRLRFPYAVFVSAFMFVALLLAIVAAGTMPTAVAATLFPRPSGPAPIRR